MRLIEDLKKYNEYTVYSAKAELKSEVVTSYLDWIWWILEPLLTMVIYVIVFGYIFKSSEPNFPVFLFIGIIMWNFFSKVINSSTTLVKSNRGIISKVYLPKYLLLVSNMYKNGYKLLFGLLVELVMMVVFRVKISPCILMAIPIFAVFFLFCFAVSTILLHFGVYVNDLSYVVSILLKFVMYLTGVFYSIENRIPGTAGTILERCNPVAFLISSMRKVMIYREMPSLLWLGIWFVFSVILSVIGIRLIYKNENSYVKVI